MHTYIPSLMSLPPTLSSHPVLSIQHALFALQISLNISSTVFIHRTSIRHFLSIKPALTGDKQSYLWHFHILDKFFHLVLSHVQSFFATLCNRIGLQPTRLLCLWDVSGRNTGVGCHFLLQGSSQLRDWSLALQVDSLPLSHRESPGVLPQETDPEQYCSDLCQILFCSLLGVLFFQVLYLGLQSILNLFLYTV